MNLSCKIKNFYKRWNIVYDEKKKFYGFKNCALSTIDRYVGDIFLFNKNLEQRFLKIIQKHISQSRIGGVRRVLEPLSERRFEDSPVYKIISKENDFVEFIKYLQVLFWLDLDSEIKEELYLGFKEDIELSMLDIRITKIRVSKDIVFYPKGVKLLDNKLLNDVLDWLSSYPTVCKHFKFALEKYQNKVYKRNLIDDLRLSFELLLKKVLKNKKGLERQKSALGEYLEGKQVPKEVGNMFWTLADYYSKYQNEYVKHEDKVKEPEIEFIIYLTGTFIRFLMVLEEVKEE